MSAARVLRWAALLLALALLNLGLAHQNLWPTPWIRLSSDISVELVVLVLAIAAAAAFGGRAGKRAQWIIAGILLLYALLRYIDVTAPALFGRRMDLYWDARHIPAVAGMVLESWPVWEAVALMAGLILGAALLLLMFRWATREICNASEERGPRSCLIGVGVALLAAYAAGMTSGALQWERWFAIPVTPVYAAQFASIGERLLGATREGAQDEAALPAFAALNGRDVFVIFLESYGRIAIDKPEFAGPVNEALAQLQTAADETGWHARSAYFDAPTFGGNSWLSHASLLTGRVVRTHDSYEAFLHGKAEQLADRFRTAGYRTVFMTPGIQGAWPEGMLLRFDRVMTGMDIDYHGAEFGFWRVPDQVSLEHLYRQEIAPEERKPLFAVFPTVMSHFPFGPTPPYLDDWSRLAAADPFDSEAVAASKALGDAVTGDKAAAYARTMVYDLKLIAGFLANRAPKDSLVVVIGDHQPPAVISGEEQNWDVPVHVFARDDAALTPFEEAGFAPGTRPEGGHLGGLEQVTGWMLQALQAPGPTPVAGLD